MKTSLACAAGALLLTVLAARADEPPSWEPFEVCSDNGRYCATVRASGETQEPPPERDYVLSVHAGARLVWSAPYAYDGYPGGLLTNDGKTFVYVSVWYRPDAPVVRIYREGGRFDLAGREFDIAEEALMPTVSHFLWLDWRRGSHGLLDDERLRIATLDGAEHVVRLDTGSLVE